MSAEHEYEHMIGEDSAELRPTSSPVPVHTPAEEDTQASQPAPAYVSTPEPVATPKLEPEPIRQATLRPFEPAADAYVVPQPPVSNDAPARSQSGGMVAREIIETFLLTLLIFWAVNTITGRFRIEGASMMPTMQEGEYILINKLAYYLEEPERGDIIVLQYPRDPSRDFIKRVIAVPGDEVVIENETVIVNGQLLSEPYINGPPKYSGDWTVPEGEYFVLGDNRNNSSDSHTWGFLPRNLIVGRGWVVYWPAAEMERVPHYEHPLGQVWQPDTQLIVSNEQ